MTCHSLSMLYKYRHTKFLWWWCIRELILHAGGEGHHTEPCGWQSINSHPAAVSMVDKTTPTPPWLHFTFLPLCFSRPLTLPVEGCPVNSAGSLGSWRQTVALCCKYGKHGISFVEATRREQSGEYSHGRYIQSGKEKPKCIFHVYGNMEVAVQGQAD